MRMNSLNECLKKTKKKQIVARQYCTELKHEDTTSEIFEKSKKVVQEPLIKKRPLKLC